MSRLADLVRGLPQPKEGPQIPAAPPRDTRPSPAAEARRRKVLAMLARDGVRYAVLVDDPNSDPVIMAVATPNGTREVLIPRDRYDPFEVLTKVGRWDTGRAAP